MSARDITTEHLVKAMDRCRIAGTLAAAMASPALAIALITTAETIACREGRVSRGTVDAKRRGAGDVDLSDDLYD